MHYNFYFDETFHDRKITIKPSGVVNVFTKDKNDNYIGVFFGYNDKLQSKVRKKLYDLENKFKQIYGLDAEFKSTVIDRKNFKYGIRSFNKNTFSFYTDLFIFLEELNPIIHVNVLNKIEWLVRNIFKMDVIEQIGFVISNSFYYSLTKFIINYHSPELIKSLYNASELNNANIFKNELLNHLEKVINTINGIEKKQRELVAFRGLFQIIQLYEFNDTIEEKYDFIYFQVFEGLIKLLKELKISSKKVNVIIDKEEATYQEALRYNFKNVKQVNSENSIQVRIADHLCGFIGRMMYSMVEDSSFKEDIVNDINNLADNDLTTKRLLNEEWFCLEEKHFNLYNKIYKGLVVNQEAYWASMTWSVCDQILMVYTLLRYFAIFNDFEEFKKQTPNEHAEYFNYNCCLDLERHYQSWTKG